MNVNRPFVNNKSYISRNIRIQNILRVQYWISITHFRTSLNWLSIQFYLSFSISQIEVIGTISAYIVNLLKYFGDQDVFDAQMCEMSPIWNTFEWLIKFSYISHHYVIKCAFRVWLTKSAAWLLYFYSYLIISDRN